MKNYIFITFILICIIGFIQSCKKESKTTETDTELYNEIKDSSGYTYYLGTPGITAGVGNTAHGFERVRFNAIAQAALDVSGKLPVGASFPAGSIIVKEIYTAATGSIDHYAIMKKAPGNNNTELGYLWAEFNVDGSTKFSTSKNGDGCINCHSGSANRDLIRTFDLH